MTKSISNHAWNDTIISGKVWTSSHIFESSYTAGSNLSDINVIQSNGLCTDTVLTNASIFAQSNVPSLAQSSLCLAFCSSYSTLDLVPRAIWADSALVALLVLHDFTYTFLTYGFICMDERQNSHWLGFTNGILGFPAGCPICTMPASSLMMSA